VVEWDGLENRCGLRATVGSNPTLSAIYLTPTSGTTTHHGYPKGYGIRIPPLPLKKNSPLVLITAPGTLQGTVFESHLLSQENPKGFENL
jgi:hypothetical protein